MLKILSSAFHIDKLEKGGRKCLNCLILWGRPISDLVIKKPVQLECTDQNHSVVIKDTVIIFLTDNGDSNVYYMIVWNR